MVDSDSDVKMRSYNALNTLYHETQQEMATLNARLGTQDNVIGELKAKLVQYERISLSVDGGNEAVLVGPSKSLIESLCKEICKLKKRKNELEMKLSRQTDTSQQVSNCVLHVGQAGMLSFAFCMGGGLRGDAIGSWQGKHWTFSQVLL